MLGGGHVVGHARIERVSEDGGPDYPVITGDYAVGARWGSRRSAGTPLASAEPLFAKLDPTVADEELARLGRP